MRQVARKSTERRLIVVVRGPVVARFVPRKHCLAQLGLRRGRRALSVLRMSGSLTCVRVMKPDGRRPLDSTWREFSTQKELFRGVGRRSIGGWCVSIDGCTHMERNAVTRHWTTARTCRFGRTVPSVNRGGLSLSSVSSASRLDTPALLVALPAGRRALGALRQVDLRCNNAITREIGRRESTSGRLRPREGGVSSEQRH